MLLNVPRTVQYRLHCASSFFTGSSHQTSGFAGSHPRRVYSKHLSRAQESGRGHKVVRTVSSANKAEATMAVPAETLTEAQMNAIREEIKEKAFIILGSSSISRQNILREMGVEFIIKKAGIDEKAIRMERPEDLVTALAKAKAVAIQQKMKEEGLQNGGLAAAAGGKVPLLITSDQVVTFEGRIREKPESPAEAKEWIQGYSRAPGGTVGATLITNLQTGFQAVAVDSTQTSWEEIPEANIDKMIKEGFVFYCAGALMVEHPLIAPFVKSMVGTTDAVMGLPIQTTWRLLQQALHSKDS